MTKRANLFIPRTDGSESVKEHVVRQLSDMYGGATVDEDNTGMWVNGDGELIEDDVDIVFTYGDVDTSELEQLAGYVKEKLDEDAVLWSVEEATTGFA